MAKKKDFEKFTKRNVHKRKSKEAARAELLRAVRETGVAFDNVKIGDITDGGVRGRVSNKVLRGETRREGIFSGSRSGFGFVSLSEGGDDIFIPDGKTGGAIDGDFVEVIYHSYNNYMGELKTEGRVAKIIEFGRKTVIGTVEEDYIRHARRRMRVYKLIPDDRRLSFMPLIRDVMDARIGDKVEARILRDGSPHPECDVIRVFGDAESREANYAAILAECEIPTDFTPEEQEAAENSARIPINYENRVIRNEVIFTIDGAGAKDLDDAVSLEKTLDGWRLGVHIADVSHYVCERTPLDRCATSRGTSVYFTDKVVPMLPPALSNGACSLNPDEDKYTLSAMIELDRDGAIISLSLEPSVIKSRMRGVYSEVNSLFDGTAPEDVSQKYAEVLHSLRLMRELYEVLLRRHETRGAIDFDTIESEIILDASGHPCQIIPRERGIAERIIEQFMLTANEAVATRLSEAVVPCVYRLHEAPPPDKYAELVTYLHNLGFDTSVITKDEPTPEGLATVLKEAKRRGLFTPVSYSMLRAMAKAKYSSEQCGHFGLGIEKYCHFTSPIRRLSDLATHRIIKNVLLGTKSAGAYVSYARRAAAAATETELRAINAERRIEDLYKTVYMADHLDEEMEGTVSSVTSFGLFVMLPNTCEGLVPISEMDGEYIFDEKNITLRSRERVYRLADTVRVRVEECDVTRGKIRFSLV